MNLIAENLLYKPDEQFHLNEVSFNFKKGNIYTIESKIPESSQKYMKQKIYINLK